VKCQFILLWLGSEGVNDAQREKNGVHIVGDDANIQ
jgi:hypothetical protein